MACDQHLPLSEASQNSRVQFVVCNLQNDSLKAKDSLNINFLVLKYLSSQTFVVLQTDFFIFILSANYKLVSFVFQTKFTRVLLFMNTQ